MKTDGVKRKLRNENLTFITHAHVNALVCAASVGLEHQEKSVCGHSSAPRRWIYEREIFHSSPSGRGTQYKLVITLNVFNAFNPSDPAEVTKDSLIISLPSRARSYDHLSLLVSWQLDISRALQIQCQPVNHQHTFCSVSFFPAVAAAAHALNNVRTRERVKLICILALLLRRHFARMQRAYLTRSSGFENRKSHTALAHSELKSKYLHCSQYHEIAV